MSEWPHARPGASHPACRPDLAGHEAVSPVSIGYSLSGPPLPRIQHGESAVCHVTFRTTLTEVILMDGFSTFRFLSIPRIFTLGNVFIESCY